MFYIFVILSLSFGSCMQAEALEEVESTLGVEVVSDEEAEVKIEVTVVVETDEEEDSFYFTIYDHNKEGGRHQIRLSEMATRLLVYSIISYYDEDIKIFVEKYPNVEKVFEYVEVKNNSITINIFKKTF